MAKDDEQVLRLGKLMLNLLGLEFLIRSYLRLLPGAKPIDSPLFADVYSCPVGTELNENELTDYLSLSQLIKKFNSLAESRNFEPIGTAIVDLRDALAHGRVSRLTQDGPMHIIKFTKPNKEKKVRVVLNEIMDDAWLQTQITTVKHAMVHVATQCNVLVPNNAQFLKVKG